MPSFEEIQHEIASLLEVSESGMTPEQLAVMDEYLDELATAEASKVDAFAGFARAELARMEFYKDEAKRLSAKAKAAENRIGYLKSRYTEIMQANGLTKVNGNAYTLSLRSSEVVSVTALIDQLPAVFVREKVTKEPNKVAIKEALQAGEVIPGCELTTSTTLQIR